ncbi:MAG: hypothetical protein IJU98_02665 [Synergistaceae bacterium]|nr:hypothetical protein [Synergistaceae bacterium]
MREVLRAMPRTEPCRICKRNIPKSHQCYALFDAETEPDFLHIWFAHPSCAKKAGWLQHRNSPISDAQVVKFWADVMVLKEKNGNLEFVR